MKLHTIAARLKLLDIGELCARRPDSRTLDGSYQLLLPLAQGQWKASRFATGRDLTFLVPAPAKRAWRPVLLLRALRLSCDELATSYQEAPLPGWFLGRAEAGSGAWELAARLSFIDLSAGPIQGGELVDTTFGLNWYLTPYHRFKANYILADLERSQQVTQTHIFGLRFDTDF